MLTRREVLKRAGQGLLAWTAMGHPTIQAKETKKGAPVSEKLPPVRAITRGPKFHWFGYYDKLQFDPTCRYVLGMEVILNDTYPDKQRNQNVYLYHVPTGRKVPIGSFCAPPQYTGEWRCDTHPRFSPDGRSVVIDSTHGGEGRPFDHAFRPRAQGREAQGRPEPALRRGSGPRACRVVEGRQMYIIDISAIVAG